MAVNGKFVGAAIALLVEAGLQLTGYSNWIVGLVLWGIAGVLAILWMVDFIRARKRPPAQSPSDASIPASLLEVSDATEKGTWTPQLTFEGRGDLKVVMEDVRATYWLLQRLCKVEASFRCLLEFSNVSGRALVRLPFSSEKATDVAVKALKLDGTSKPIELQGQIIDHDLILTPPPGYFESGQRFQMQFAASYRRYRDGAR